MCIRDSIQTANAVVVSKKQAAIQPITREAWEKTTAEAENGAGSRGGPAWLSAILRSR